MRAFVLGVVVVMIAAPALADKASDYIAQAYAKFTRRDFKGAIKDCSKAIELKPDYAEAYMRRGLAKQSLGDLHGAFEDLEKAIQLKPDSAEAYSGRAYLQIANGDLNSAISDFNTAIRFNPKYPLAYIGRGGIKLQEADLGGRHRRLQDSHGHSAWSSCHLWFQFRARLLQTRRGEAGGGTSRCGHRELLRGHQTQSKLCGRLPTPRHGGEDQRRHRQGERGLSAGSSVAVGRHIRAEFYKRGCQEKTLFPLLEEQIVLRHPAHWVEVGGGDPQFLSRFHSAFRLPL